MMVNGNCQPGRLWNPLGESPLDEPLEDYLDEELPAVDSTISWLGSWTI